MLFRSKNLAQQLQQAQNGKGQGQNGQGQQGRNRGRDPLDRETGDSNDNGGDLPKKGETPSQRAGRLTEELRRRLADPNRPKDETDYLERLLNHQ